MPACAQHGEIHAAVRGERIFILIYVHAAQFIKLIRHGGEQLRRAPCDGHTHIAIPAGELPQLQIKKDGHFRRGERKRFERGDQRVDGLHGALLAAVSLLRPVTDEGAFALRHLDHAKLAQLIVSALDRAARKAELIRERTHGRKLGAVGQAPGADVRAHGVHDLLVDRNVAFCVNSKKHVVHLVMQVCTIVQL